MEDPFGEARAQSNKSVQDWRAELLSLSPQEAYEVVIREDSVEAYEDGYARYQSLYPALRPLEAT